MPTQLGIITLLVACNLGGDQEAFSLHDALPRCAFLAPIDEDRSSDTLCI